MLPTWLDLECTILRLKENAYYTISFGTVKPYMKLFDMSIRSPINQESIDQMISEGWRAVISDEMFAKYGVCRFDHKEIRLRPELGGYRRDETLFHEIIHAFYGKETADTKISGLPYWQENGKIVEWMSRKLRANPVLLKHVITAFKLKPQIYDKISYMVFSDVSNTQTVLPFISEDIMMD